MRLHVVRQPDAEPAVPGSPRQRPPAPARPWSAAASAPTTPASTTPTDRRTAQSEPATIHAIGAVRSDRTPQSDLTERRLITSASTTVSAPFRGSDGWSRPTPYESGLAAVARHDVHIERVWPMRSPSTGLLEASSSAYFQGDRRGTPPANIVPVGGLRMNQAFPHEPVMADEVVGLFAPVPPGLILDATLGGGGHAAAILGAHPGTSVLGIDRDPAAVAAASAALAPSPAAPSSTGPGSTPWPRWWPTSSPARASPWTNAASPGPCSTSG